MKKILLVVLITALLCAALSGCAGQADKPAGAATPDSTVSGGAPGAEPQSAGLTLAQIKTAAEAAGYSVSDGHQLVFMKDAIGGISIEIVADGDDTLYSVVECATEEAAISNAKEIDDAGYSISLRNGKFISCYNADNKGEERKQLLTAILSCEPLPAPN